jgi:lipoprotein-anchoring transpeptidase ErfK/SrfK
VSNREGTRPLIFVCAAATVALLVWAPALATAQGAPAPSPPEPAPQPGNPTFDLKIKGAKHGKVRVGKRIRAFGTLRPWQPGKQVAVTLMRGDRTLKKEILGVIRGEGDAGHFELRGPVLVRPGRYQATAQLAGSAATASTHKFKPKYPSLHHGSKGREVKLFNRLLDKQGYVPSNGRRYSTRTGRAVLAYRKVHGMARITRATSGIFKKLAGGRGAYKLKHPGAGKHVEVNIGRQVMVLADDGKAQRTYPVSTGKASTPTVRGHFRFYRRQPGFNSVGMYYSVYFHGGYAVHGYHDVPATYPASHGCVRTPVPDARSVYNWVQLGMSIYVY